MSMNLVPGNQLVTANGVIGTSGNPIRVFHIHILSGASAGVVQLRNGTSDTDPIYIQETGISSTGADFPYNAGILFQNGCFLDEDTAPTSTLVVYTEEH